MELYPVMKTSELHGYIFKTVLTEKSRTEECLLYGSVYMKFK